MLDDDFFELDEDLLNATDYFGKNIDEIGNLDADISHQVRLFNCTGDDIINKHLFHSDGFMENSEIKLIQYNGKTFINQILFDLNLSEDVLTDAKMLQDLLNKARTNIQTLCVSSRENSSFFTRKSFFMLRLQTTTFFFQLRQLFYTKRIKSSTVDTLIKPISIYLEYLSALPIVDVLHTIHSTLGNESTSPAYHLLHGHIEWRWIYLTLRLRIEQEKFGLNVMISPSTLRETEFEEKLQLFIYDLIVVSAAKFNKLHILELPTKTPFICPCIKETWLLIQLLVEKVNENGGFNSFWFYFNGALKLFREQKSPYANVKQQNITRNTINIYPNDCVLFSLWLLNGVAILNGFTEDGVFNGATCLRVKENNDLLESLIRSFINCEPSEQHFRTCLLTISALITEWWTQKSEILMLFWEYFHKKLNSSFFVSGAVPSSLAVTSNTAFGYLEQIYKILENEHLSCNLSSFTIFINLLGKILKRLVRTDMKNQIQKIMGRIFTKFSESKLNALNEIGIHNLVTLFLTLAVTSGLNDIGHRLQNILLQLRLEKLPAPRQTCLIKGHMALLILHTEQQIGIQSYVIRLLEQVTRLSSDENKLAILKIMAQACEQLFMKQDIFDLGEFILIESWLSDYLSLCSQSEQEKCLQFINNILLKISCIELQQQYTEPYLKVMQSIFKYILPHVKQIYRQSNVFSNVPEIAATFCLYATGTNGLPHFDDLFKYFTEIPCCDTQTTIKFLVSILSTNKLNRIDQIIIIRHWIRCSTLSISANEDIKQLTKIVMNLSDFRVMCNATEQEMLDAKEPLSIFFSACGHAYDSAPDAVRKTIADHLQASILGFEKLIPISETPPTIFKMHIVIALIIFNCSPIVYVRSKPTCFFNVIMNHYILPLSLLMGKQQKPISIQAVHKIWHLIVGGIEKIDYKSDAHLQKVFTDLIVKWVPQFRLMAMQRFVSKPFISCVHHSQSSTLHFIFDKLVTNFLSAQRRETHQNAPIVVTILTDVLANIVNESDKVQILMNSTTITLLEHAMMVDDTLPSKAMILDFFTNLFKSAAYVATLELRALLTSNLKTLTTKHLSYYSSFYFQLILKLAKINPNAVRPIMDHLKDQICVVEQLRGAGPDAKLRNSLKQLEEIVN